MALTREWRPRFRREPEPAQLELKLYTDELDLDGHVDAQGIEYVGKARKQNNGLWTCAAKVGRALCLVEVAVKPLPATAQP